MYGRLYSADAKQYWQKFSRTALRMLGHHERLDSNSLHRKEELSTATSADYLTQIISHNGTVCSVRVFVNVTGNYTLTLQMNINRDR